QSGMLMHLHLHASAQKKYSDAPEQAQTQARGRSINKLGLIGLIDSLKNTVSSLKWEPAGTEWGDYYDATNYTRAAFDYKSQLVKDFLQRIQPGQVWDLGANTGVFSRLASEMGIPTISSDIDPAAVEKNYRDMRKNK